MIFIIRVVLYVAIIQLGTIMPRLPAVSILSEAAVDQDDGITFTKIYPTLKHPSTYDAHGYKFFAIKEAPFFLTDQDHSVVFHIYVMPCPQKRGFRSGFASRNHFSPSKADQDELASVIQNLFECHLLRGRGTLRWFQGGYPLQVESHYHFPDPHKPTHRANWSKYGDIDNLQKFLFNAMQRARLIGNDRNIVSSNSRNKIISRTDGDMNKNFVMHGGYAIKVMLDFT